MFNCHEIINHSGYRAFNWLFVGIKEEAELASKSYKYVYLAMKQLAVEAKEKFGIL